MSLRIKIEKYKQMISNDRTFSWLSVKMMDMKPVGHTSLALFIWRTIWFVDSDQCRQAASCFTLPLKFVTGKKSNVGQLHTGQKECSTTEISSRSLRQRSKFIQSTHLFCKKETIDFFFLPTEHKGKEMPFPFIRRVYFLIEGQTEIQLSTWTIVCLPSTIHTANQSFCSQVSRCLAASTA